MRQKSVPAKEPATQVVKNVLARRDGHFSAEDKIRILAGRTAGRGLSPGPPSTRSAVRRGGRPSTWCRGRIGAGRDLHSQSDGGDCVDRSVVVPTIAGMGKGALPNGPSYRAHPRLYQPQRKKGEFGGFVLYRSTNFRPRQPTVSL
jgi:hypothetical protein